MKNILGGEHKKTWVIGHCECCGKNGKIRTDIQNAASGSEYKMPAGTKTAAKKRDVKIPTLIHLDAETKAILEADSAGCGLSHAAYVRMLIRKERTAQDRAIAAGR